MRGTSVPFLLSVIHGSVCELARTLGKVSDCTWIAGAAIGATY